MPLSDIVQTPVARLRVSARDHNRLLCKETQEMERASKKSGDTCCECGIKIPKFMEYHHLNGHVTGLSSGSLRTICQFCHNLKHPIWAADKGRIIPIYAPDFTQSDLHRLAWTCLAWRNDPVTSGSISSIIDTIDARRDLLEGITGVVSAAPLIEMAFTLKNLKIEKVNILDTFARVDQSLRFWPAEVTTDFEDLRSSARLSSLRDRGFEIVTDEVAEILRAQSRIDPSDILGRRDLPQDHLDLEEDENDAQFIGDGPDELLSTIDGLSDFDFEEDED